MSNFFYLLFASLALRVGVEGCWRRSKLSLGKDRVRSHDIFAQYFLLFFFMDEVAKHWVSFGRHVLYCYLYIYIKKTASLWEFILLSDEILQDLHD